MAVGAVEDACTGIKVRTLHHLLGRAGSSDGKSKEEDRGGEDPGRQHFGGQVVVLV